MSPYVVHDGRLCPSVFLPKSKASKIMATAVIPVIRVGRNVTDSVAAPTAVASAIDFGDGRLNTSVMAKSRGGRSQKLCEKFAPSADTAYPFRLKAKIAAAAASGPSPRYFLVKTNKEVVERSIKKIITELYAEEEFPSADAAMVKNENLRSTRASGPSAPLPI
jgi:hypothetical protein